MHSVRSARLVFHPHSPTVCVTLLEMFRNTGSNGNIYRQVCCIFSNFTSQRCNPIASMPSRHRPPQAGKARSTSRSENLPRTVSQLSCTMLDCPPNISSVCRRRRSGRGAEDKAEHQARGAKRNAALVTGCEAREIASFGPILGALMEPCPIVADLISRRVNWGGARGGPRVTAVMERVRNSHSHFHASSITSSKSDLSAALPKRTLSLGCSGRPLRARGAAGLGSRVAPARLLKPPRTRATRHVTVTPPPPERHSAWREEEGRETGTLMGKRRREEEGGGGSLDRLWRAETHLSMVAMTLYIGVMCSVCRPKPGGARCQERE